MLFSFKKYILNFTATHARERAHNTLQQARGKCALGDVGLSVPQHKRTGPQTMVSRDQKPNEVASPFM